MMHAPDGHLDPAGIHHFPVRVYFEDTDFSGHVYHAAYLKFLERGRTEFLRAHDIHHHRLQAEGRVFAVANLAIDFRAPARIDDVVNVRTALAELGGARFVLEQTIVREETPIVQASVTAVLLTLEGKPVRLPEALRERFARA